MKVQIIIQTKESVKTRIIKSLGQPQAFNFLPLH